MERKKLKNSDDAVVGIIVAILLIGLFITVISIVQTEFVPNWMQQIEADHMDVVSAQFDQLKFAIDIQAVLNITDNPISVPITLGSNNIPILQSERASGAIEIIENEIEINITHNESNVMTVTSFSLGIIKFTSFNNYYLNQEIIYESGSLIKNQDDGNIMYVYPKLVETYNDSNVINLSFTIVNIRGVGDKLVASGHGNFPIQVEFSEDSTSYSMNQVYYLNITSSNNESWFIFMNKKINELELNVPPPQNIGNTISIDFESEPRIVNIFVKHNEIYAQVAPGWIENKD